MSQIPGTGPAAQVPAAGPAPRRQFYVKRQAQGARTTGSANVTDQFQIPIPSNAIAFVGATINPVSAGVTNYGTFQVQLVDRDLANASNVVSFCFSRGTKSSFGCQVVDPAVQLLNVGVTAVDATVTYTAVFYFLLTDIQGATVDNIPFTTIGGNEVVVTVTFTSAATTAQTVDFTAIGSADVLEILSAFFYAPSGTATGNAGLYDGTTRVDYDSTAAVASYFFNTGAKGSRILFASQAQAVVLKARFVIGAASAGTTTLVVTYRATMER